MTDKELCIAAVSAMENSYSPYSGYKVGAALLCADGTVYTGCNIENASYSPTICAERVAIFKAISEGNTTFTKIAVAGGKSGNIEGEFQPCGVCRQVLAEFCNNDFEVLLVTSTNEYNSLTLAELLPNSFSKKNIK